jgi:ubiquinone biosynthesis protein COQ4
MFQPSASFAPRRALHALGNLLRDPDDLPQVFTVIQALSGDTPERIVRRLRADPVGARLLRDRADIVPRLADRAALRALPEGSLGRAYLAFLESEGISAEGLIAASEAGRAAVDDDATDAAWMHRRMRDTHDLWHAVTGYRGDVLGEAALLGFLLAQTGNPGVGLIVATALLRAAREPSARRLIVEGFRRGRRAAWLPAVEWEALLALPLADVRARLCVDAPPSYVPVRSAELKARLAA